VVARWSIWNKLLFGIAMLFLIVATLSISGILGVSSYRGLVRSISHRAANCRWPRSSRGAWTSCGSRRAGSGSGMIRGTAPATTGSHREDFRIARLEVSQALARYRDRLSLAEGDLSAIR